MDDLFDEILNRPKLEQKRPTGDGQRNDVQLAKAVTKLEDQSKKIPSYEQLLKQAELNKQNQNVVNAEFIRQDQSNAATVARRQSDGVNRSKPKTLDDLKSAVNSLGMKVVAAGGGSAAKQSQSTAGQSRLSVSSKTKVVKSKIKGNAGVGGGDLIALNSQRRDLRTIEEIQRYLEQKKNPARNSTDEQGSRYQSSTQQKNGRSKSPPKSRTGKRKSTDVQSLQGGNKNSNEISIVIQELFPSRRKKEFLSEEFVFDDEDSDYDGDDMEASVGEMLREEQRSSKIARLEDALELKRQQQEEQRLKNKKKGGDRSS
ncbi:hypothetical protein MP228_011117 [Amoeboaphelidium protococcarum]|nr:hypothetical protein MP228_011117 [Amoeboaphelidium protococcarum]